MGGKSLPTARTAPGRRHKYGARHSCSVTSSAVGHVGALAATNIRVTTPVREDGDNESVRRYPSAVEFVISEQFTSKLRFASASLNGSSLVGKGAQA